MAKAIAINGRTEAVMNTLSVGPGAAAHTYELAGRRYVYEVAGQWFLQEPGQLRRVVEVA